MTNLRAKKKSEWQFLVSKRFHWGLKSSLLSEGLEISERS